MGVFTDYISSLGINPNKVKESYGWWAFNLNDCASVRIYFKEGETIRVWATFVPDYVRVGLFKFIYPDDVYCPISSEPVEFVTESDVVEALRELAVFTYDHN